MQTHLTNGNPFFTATNATEAPFILGTKFTYADLALYQILHDEDLTQQGREGLKEYPALLRLVNAVEGRERVKRYLNSERYRG